MTETKLFIHGRYVDAHSGKSFDNLNPATGESLGKVQIADEKDVNDAVQSALEGYTEWSAYSGIQRGRVLHRVQEILRARNNELAKWETLDTGKPLQESISVDIHLGADCFEYYAGVAPTLSGEHMIFPGGFSYTRREPLGVCAGIGAWNYPLQVACWKIAPALACGNAMVYKPAELTPITSAMLGEILIEAGVPKGVYNVVQGFGETGAMLSRHSDIAKVSLTGEVGTGKRVMADAAATLKRVTMELGGKSPLLVFEDADINNAVSAAMLGNFYTQGEICTNCTRVFVHHTIKNAFVKQLLHRTAKLKLGDPTNPQTQVGSLINRDHQQKVLACIEKLNWRALNCLLAVVCRMTHNWQTALLLNRPSLTNAKTICRMSKRKFLVPCFLYCPLRKKTKLSNGQTTLPTDWRRAFLPKTLSEPTESSPAYKRESVGLIIIMFIRCNCPPAVSNNPVSGRKTAWRPLNNTPS